MSNAELIEYFESGIRPLKMPIEINPGIKISDYDLFISTHLLQIKNLGSNTDHPIVLRLRWLKDAIEKGG